MAPETVFFVLALSVGAAMGSSLEWNMFGEYVDFSVLFVLIIYVTVNNFSVMLGQSLVFLG